MSQLIWKSIKIKLEIQVFTILGQTLLTFWRPDFFHPKHRSVKNHGFDFILVDEIFDHKKWTEVIVKLYHSIERKLLYKILY